MITDKAHKKPTLCNTNRINLFTATVCTFLYDLMFDSEKVIFHFLFFDLCHGLTDPDWK